MKPEGIVQLKKNVPALNTPEFDDWLQHWHAEHNTPDQMRVRTKNADLKPGEAGRISERSYRVTDKGRAALR